VRIALPTGFGEPEVAPEIVVRVKVQVPFVTEVELKKFASPPELVPK
jgi:hypothetical protein